jgi:cysteine desulfurase
MNERIYLDWNATAPLRAPARTAMVAAMDVCGNPSSVHAEGRAAKHLVEDAREKVAALVGATARDVVFTSGGTEANVFALWPFEGRTRLLVSSIEHPSVLAGGRFAPAAVETVPVAADGRVDLLVLRRRLAELAADGVRIFVSIMHANNETGVVQPICEAAQAVHERGGVLHVDAVQTAGRIPCDIKALGADLLTVSAHKIGGPKGAGALIKRTEDSHLAPLLTGGGQERGARAGTENVAAIAGFGASAEAASAALRGIGASYGHEAKDLRDRLEAGLRTATPDVVIFGADVERLPNTTLFSLHGLKAETAVIAFDLEGIAVSSGAACSSGKVAPSHVLAAMGVAPSLARGAVRVSLGPTTTERDIERFLEAWNKMSGALLKSRGIAA